MGYKEKKNIKKRKEKAQRERGARHRMGIAILWLKYGIYVELS